MAALVAVMIMVSIGTFRWESIRNLKRYPLSTNLVMLVTVGVVLATHNLAFGVVAGVLLASLFFANKIGHYLDIDSERSADGTRRHYQVSGQVFFASSGRFIAAFDLRETLEHVLIDLRHAHLWDVTAVAALDKVILGFRQRGVQVDVLGLNAASATLVDRSAPMTSRAPWTFSPAIERSATRRAGMSWPFRCGGEPAAPRISADRGQHGDTALHRCLRARRPSARGGRRRERCRTPAPETASA